MPEPGQTNEVIEPQLPSALERVELLEMPGEAAFENLADLPELETPPTIEEVFNQQSIRDLRIQGNDTYIRSRLLTAVREFSPRFDQSNLNISIIDDASFSLEQFYKHRGFADAQVTWELEEGRVAVIQISEGPYVELGKITFSGNDSVESSELKGFATLGTEQRRNTERVLSVLPFVEDNLPFVQEDIDRGGRLIPRYYATIGYLEAEVTDIDITRQNGKADIRYTIKEGEPHTFGEIRVTGDFGRMEQKKALELLVEKKKEVFSQGTVIEMEAALRDAYLDLGYFAAEIRAESDIIPAQRKVDVSFQVDAGEIYTVADISVEGNTRLRDRYFQRNFRPLLGKEYSAKELDKALADMIATGLFTDLQVDPRPAGLSKEQFEDILAGAEGTPSLAEMGNTELTLFTEVEEAPRRRLSVFAGFSSFEGAIGGFLYDNLNLFGMGRSLNITAEFTQRGLNGQLRLRDPWLLGRDRGFELGLGALTRDFDGYDKQEFNLTATADWKVTKHWTLVAQTAVRRLDLDEIEIVNSPVGPTTYSEYVLGISQTLDFRNDPLNPTNGWVFTAGLEQIAPIETSEVTYTRGNASISYYKTFGRHRLGLGARVGLLSSLGDDDVVPIDGRFFNGGSRTVRSFTERELGPRDPGSGNPIGGRFRSVYNLEYAIPAGKNFFVAFFIDAGNVLEEVPASNTFEDMSYAIGAGIRLDLPIGPLRIDYGWNPDRGPDDDFGALHLSFGTAF